MITGLSQFGPSFAVLLFARVSVGGVAWLRIVSAAIVFAVWRRPWRTFFAAARTTQQLMVALGVVFALMNYSFYTAIDRLPLGTVAAIEFVGPILLALTGCPYPPQPRGVGPGRKRRLSPHQRSVHG